MFKPAIAAILAVAITASPAFAGDKLVKGHVRKDGTYVQPHLRSSPNSTRLDNYSTRGNSNPYTGRQGSRSADSFDSFSSGGHSSGKSRRAWQ